MKVLFVAALAAGLAMPAVASDLCSNPRAPEIVRSICLDYGEEAGIDYEGMKQRTKESEGEVRLPPQARRLELAPLEPCQHCGLEIGPFDIFGSAPLNPPRRER